MKTVKMFAFAILGAISLIANTLVSASAYSGTLADENISYNKSFVLNVKANNLTYATAEATYDDGTPAAKTFTDGSISTGSINIKTLTGLTTAYASVTVTVTSTSGLTGAAIALPGYVLRQGVNWGVKATTDLTAASITTALNKIDWLTAVRTDSAILITAKVPGSYYNLIPISSKSSISTSSAYMEGGYDNAVVTINGVDLIRGRDWFVGTTTDTAAISLAAAINANAVLSPLITATAGTGADVGIISLVSDASGASKNFSLKSSIPAALTMSGTAMTGGLNAAFTNGSKNIVIANHGFNVALPVLYTEGTAAVSPLVDQTTYYAIVVDDNNLQLATTSTSAVLGAGYGLAITTTGTTGHTYTLTPTPIAGAAYTSFKWEISDDAETWADMEVDSVTVSNFGTLPLSTSWDLDTSSDYVRFSIIAPTAGALNMNVTVSGLPYSEFVRTTGDTITGRTNFVSAPIVMTGSAGTLTTASTVTALSASITGTGASALDVAGGANFGSGNVALINAAGKIPAVSSTYFASLDGSSLLKISSVAVNAVEPEAVKAGTYSNITLPSANVAAGALNSVTTLKVSGESVFGTLPNVSTITASGIMDLASILYVGQLEVRESGGTGIGWKTKAQLAADVTGGAGRIWYCSDCTKDAVVVSTDNAAGAIATLADKTVAIQ